ncbi:MAG: hypothetical protein AAGF20_04955 [Pseudomonadota bacterium]
MKKLSGLSIGAVMSLAFAAYAETPLPQVDAASFEQILGTDWNGSLTYLNYSAPFKDFTIPAQVEVTSAANGVSLFFKYPDEPQQNGGQTLEISEQGRRFGGDRVTLSMTDAEGMTEIRTEGPCQDLGRAASCEMIYRFSNVSMGVKKLVTYEGESQSFRRSEFQFSR